MSTTEAGVVAVAVVGLTQLLKWSNLIPDRYGPGAVLAWAALGTLMWAWSLGRLQQALAFDLFSGWIVIAATAAGVYGFTRASAASVTKMAPPPATGAGSERTTDEVVTAPRLSDEDVERITRRGIEALSEHIDDVEQRRGPPPAPSIPFSTTLKG
jgi:hypothetical protein